MVGPNGVTNRQVIRSFFSASTTPALQTKILNMMMAAPEATAVGAMDATDEPVPTSGPEVKMPDFQMPILKMPILGIYAGRPLVSREAALARFPDAEYTQIPGTGHFLMLEKPEEFNRLLLAFLAKQKY